LFNYYICSLTSQHKEGHSIIADFGQVISWTIVAYVTWMIVNDEDISGAWRPILHDFGRDHFIPSAATEFIQPYDCEC